MRKILFILALMLITPTITHATAPLEAPTGTEVPVIMYHLITERPKYIGKYGVTPAELEDDLVYLKTNGYTTVFMQELINHVNHGTPLPEKPIVLTFDDGNFSDYQYLLPLLEKHDMKAVIAIIGKATEECTVLMEQYPTARQSNLSWPHVKELHASGRVEVQNHGFNVHGKGGSGERKGESLEAYHARLYEDLKKVQDLCIQHIGLAPTTFVYPLGIMGKESRTVLEKLGMSASLSCHEGITIVRQGDHDCLFKMHRYNRPSGQPVKVILDKIAKIKR